MSSPREYPTKEMLKVAVAITDTSLEEATRKRLEKKKSLMKLRMKIKLTNKLLVRIHPYYLKGHQLSSTRAGDSL